MSRIPNEKLCSIYFIRHGETIWNQQGQLTGHEDVALSKEGELQTYYAADLLRKVNFRAAYSSDLSRALKTAEIIVEGREIPVQTSESLRERNFGEYEGTTHYIVLGLQKQVAHLSDGEQANYKPTPTFESDNEVMSRVMPYLRRIASQHLNEPILVSTHYGVIRLLLIEMKVITRSDFPQIKNSSVLRVISNGTSFYVAQGLNIT